ncbi:MAG TPA: MFS transporter [Ramlibacter sp.]|nr:MFS transporter [Ramlibacter sp.]
MSPAAPAALVPRPWLALFSMLAVQVLATLALGAAPVMAPAVGPQLGIAPERVGLFTGLAYLFAMVSGLASGPWVNRVGGVRLMQFLLAGVALGTACATLGWPLALLFAAALIGAGYGGVNPASAGVLGHHAPPGSPGLFFAMKQAGVPIGIALAGLLVPAGLAVLGWRGTAWAIGGGCLLLAAVLLPVVTILDPHERSAAPRGLELMQTLRAVMRHPGLRRLSLVSLVYAMSQLGFLTFSVSLLTLDLGLSLALAAGLLSASQVACTLVRVALGHVGDRWIAPHLLLGGVGVAMAVACLALALLPRQPPVLLAAAVVVLAGASTMGWNGVYFAQLVRTVPREQLAASAGGTQFFTFTGGMVGPILFGQVLRETGSYAVAYGLLAVTSLLAGAVMLRPPPGGSTGVDIATRRRRT